MRRIRNLDDIATGLDALMTIDPRLQAIRLVAGDDIWLSPFYQRDSAVISVHMYAGMPYAEYFAGCEAIFRNHRGRPHWGKMHSLGARELQDMYPQWDRFHAVRRQLDPAGLFMNDHLTHLFGR
mgnify:CR=1 FL=1